MKRKCKFGQKQALIFDGSSKSLISTYSESLMNVSYICNLLKIKLIFPLGFNKSNKRRGICNKENNQEAFLVMTNFSIAAINRSIMFCESFIKFLLNAYENQEYSDASKENIIRTLRNFTCDENFREALRKLKVNDIFQKLIQNGRDDSITCHAFMGYVNLLGDDRRKAKLITADPKIIDMLVGLFDYTCFDESATRTGWTLPIILSPLSVLESKHSKYALECTIRRISYFHANFRSSKTNKRKI